MTVEGFLTEITTISDKHKQIDQSTGRLFNIFDITNISWKEVPVCRFIHELLNPNGSHYQKGKYLKLFCEYVLGIDVSEKQCDLANVSREYPIKKDKRIDIYIELADKKIPLEAKIFSGDRDSQCADYLEYAQNSKLYYLTLNEQEPSENSALGNMDSIINITFGNHILLWLQKCLEDKETIRLAPVREVILQFDAVIRNLTGRLECDKEMEIRDAILKSEKNLKSAIEIERALKSAKSQLLETVLKEIEVNIGDKLTRISNTEFSYEKLVDTYYDKKGSTYPGIDYFIKSTSKPNIDIWLRVEVDYNLYVGFCVVENNKWNGSLLSLAEAKEALPGLDVAVNNKGWWLYWEYLLNNDKNETPNFKEYNDIYISLCDEEKLESFVKAAVKQILTLKEKALRSYDI